MSAEQAIAITAKLYECRRAARSLLGAHYKRDMDLWATSIRDGAKLVGVSELAVAQAIARKTDGFGALIVLAAYVEMMEPSE
jgi:hypothetical protein